MKLMRVGAPGAEKPAMMGTDGVIRDLSAHAADIDGSVLGDAALERLRGIDPGSLPAVDPGTRIGPCVGSISKLVCVGLNYADHAAESNLPIPPEPILFGKAISTVVGPNDDVEKPRGSQALDYEVELAIVIGKTCKYVDEADAFDHIAGYAVFNDVSERDFQNKRAGQWIKGKSHDTFGPLGPWMVTKDEVPDPGALAMELKVNGGVRQKGSTATLIFKVPHIVSYISQFMTLHPGDVIPTGTPPGVAMGMKPPGWLSVGDEVELTIAGLGVQRQRIVAA